MAKSRSRRVDANRPKSHATVEELPGSEDAPTYYVNNTSIETSVWDVRLKLAHTVEVNPQKNLTRVKRVAEVRMSPQHARVVADFLQEHLKNYEATFGRIPRAAN